MKCSVDLSFKITVFISIAAVFALTLPAVFVAHIENDEVIYRAIAEKLVDHPADFSLKGTAVLAQLPPAQYDHPIFRHPPVFFYLLALIYKFLGINWGILLSVVCGAGSVVAGMLIARRLRGLEIAVITGFFLCCCPLLLYASTKLWIDATFTCLMTLAFYLFIAAYERKKYAGIALAGLVLGAAILSKYTALGIIPAIMWYAFHKRGDVKAFLLSILVFASCAFIVCIPWLMCYKMAMGSIFASQFTITQDYLDRFPFVMRSLRQPAYFYFAQLGAVAPLYIFAFLGGLKRWKKPETQALLLWAGTFIAGFTVISALHALGYALRYLLPASIPLAILSAETVSDSKKWVLPVIGIFLVYQLATTIINSYVFQTADLRSPFDYLPR